MKSKILVGSESFMDQLNASAQSATKSLYVQAMTFEGDQAGEQLIDLMIQCPASDKRLLIDSFSKVVVSDHFVFGPEYIRNKLFRKEISNTKGLLEKAIQNGIEVKYTNPVGFLMTKYPLRNHKKMVIVDSETAFLGGINFSDHNFSWLDMMVHFDDPSMAECLAEDFQATWEGRNQSNQFEFGKSSIWFFNGIKSKGLYESFFEQIARARYSIHIISPYVSDPLLSVLKIASNNHVDITIISPEENNKSIFKNNLQAAATEGYFSLRHFPGMFHLKAILIDDEELIFGSSNYDLVSYYFEQEVVLSTKESSIVTQFMSNVLKPMFDRSNEVNSVKKKFNLSRIMLNGLDRFFNFLSKTILKPN